MTRDHSIRAAGTIEALAVAEAWARLGALRAGLSEGISTAATASRGNAIDFMPPVSRTAGEKRSFLPQL
jgi:hypothetical protein